jgi:hypothetical protein
VTNDANIISKVESARRRRALRKGAIAGSPHDSTTIHDFGNVLPIAKFQVYNPAHQLLAERLTCLLKPNPKPQAVKPCNYCGLSYKSRTPDIFSEDRGTDLGHQSR